MRLLDDGRTDLRHHLVLRAGAAGAADRADELPVLDERNAAPEAMTPSSVRR